MKKVNLEKFAGGALSVRASRAINQVMYNMQDDNTPAKTKRKVVIELTFTQDDNREDVQVDIDVKTKLAAETTSRTRMFVGKDLDSGEVDYREYGQKDTIKGQMEMNSETGEIQDTEPSSQTPKNIRDFRRTANAE